MTSGIQFSTLEKAYIEVTQDRLSHAVIAWHLSLITGIPRKRKGVKDYISRHRRSDTPS